MGLRYFSPNVVSCPGCGRTDRHNFQKLAQSIKVHIKKKLPQWQRRFPGIEQLTIAVMGCVVNGPGESRHADIGISYPGRSETPVAGVYAKGKRIATLKGKNIKDQFIAILEDFIRKNYR